MTNSPNRIEAAQARVDQISMDVAAASVEAAEASAYARVAPKDEKVAAARANAEKQAALKALKDALKVAQKAHKDAEAETEKAAKAAEKSAKEAADKAAKEAEKAAKADAKRNAAKAAADLAADNADNPFFGDEINWQLLGKWLAERAKDRVCYVEGAGWGEWTGTHWEFSVKPQATLLDRVRRSWAGLDTPVTQKLNAGPRSAVYALEHAQGALTLDRQLFNAPRVAHLIAFKNTTVNLKTGKRMAHDPKHYMTGCLRTNYNEKANFQRVYDAFARFWPKDPETAVMFQTSIGYSLTAEVSAKRMFFMVGNQDNALANGDNGKSLVQNALVRLFGLGIGGWGAAVKSAIIVDTGDRDANSHDGAKGPLIWRRFSMSSEFRNGATINAGEFNLLSGGDALSARLPHSPLSVEFVNTTAMWFSMNTVPRFKTWDKATKVRLTPFPFLETFHDADSCPPGGQVKELGLADWLASDEGQEALALYAVKGAIRFYAVNGGKAGNIPDAPSVLAMRDQILATSNPYADLFEDMFVFDPMIDLQEKAVNTLLRDYLGQQAKTYEKDTFFKALNGMGVVKVKVKGERYLRGVGLTDRGRGVLKIGGIATPEFRRGTVVSIAAE